MADFGGTVHQSGETGSGLKDSIAAKQAIVRGCTQYIKTGSCAYGDACKDSHSHGADRAAAPASRGATDYEMASYEIKTAIDHLLKKTRICRLFKEEGTCDFGSACRFAHIAGPDALQILSGFCSRSISDLVD